MAKHSPYLIFSIVVLSTLVNCSQNKEAKSELAKDNSETANYEVTEDKSSLAEYYEAPHIKEWYPERILPPAFDYNMDISNKSLIDLWLLRNEIFARNGYLFDDAVLRGHFNQFKWYQPIFDLDEFKVQLNKDEQSFVNRVLKRENELAASRYTKKGQYEMVSLDHVYNLIQFKSIDNSLSTKLASNNFAIVPAKHEQLFHVYDNNHYEYIPNFITTDLYLQVLHKHFSSTLQKVEEYNLMPLLNELLKNLYLQSLNTLPNNSDPKIQAAAQFASTYLGIAYSLITNKIQAPDDPIVKQEFEKVISAQGKGSFFLKYDLMLYSQFEPRGNYTKSEELKQYFRCVKWLNTAPILLDDDERFLAAVFIAALIRNSNENLNDFQRFNSAIKFIVGEEDNASINNLVDILSTEDAKNLETLANDNSLAQIRRELEKTSVDRIKPKIEDGNGKGSSSYKSILFTAGRYTFDSEILSRLIDIQRSQPKRPFPRGLDVFASLGNEVATAILMNEYQDQKKWPAFPDTLKLLQRQFEKFDRWNENIYTKTFESFTKLDDHDSRYPLFMKTPSWSRKSLSTSLSAWTELRHDLLLYAEQPYAAQAGQGGGPPPPMHVSYVEPNITFWKKSLELLDFQEKELVRMNLMNEDIQGIIAELRGIGNLLLTVSNKELANENVTLSEFHNLSYLGGKIEYLTFRIFGSDHLPEKERLVSLVADVYNYNGIYLEEAVGLVDEIYTVAEINGKPYLTKGAVFSYYEFTNASPLSDEEWKDRLKAGDTPNRPTWLKEIIVNAPSLESKSSYSF